MTLSIPQSREETPVSAITPYPDPIISDYQKAFEAYFGGKAPKVTRRTAKGYIIHGSQGPSQLLSEAHMKRLTRVMLTWCRDRRAS